MIGRTNVFGGGVIPISDWTMLDPSDITFFGNQYTSAPTVTWNPDGSFDAINPGTSYFQYNGSVGFSFILHSNECAMLCCNTIRANTIRDYYSGDYNFANTFGAYISQTFPPMLFSNAQYVYIYPSYPYPAVTETNPKITVSWTNAQNSGVVTNPGMEGVRIYKMPRADFFGHFES